MRRTVPLLVAAAASLIAVLLAATGCGDGPSNTNSSGSGEKSFTKADAVTIAGKQYSVTMKTSKGDIVVELFADKAPQTVNSFVFLAKKGFFDGLAFHRVVKGFVIQTGDPTGSGSGGPGYSTKDEPNQLSNERGTLAMAKVSGATEFGSQFFINLTNNTALDYNNPTPNKFYPFGKVTSGMDVVDAIANVPVDAGGKPTTPVTITSVTITEE